MLFMLSLVCLQLLLPNLNISPLHQQTLLLQSLNPSFDEALQIETADFALLKKAYFDDDGGHTEGVAFKDGLTLVANYDQGLEIINASDPTHPVKLASKKTKGNALDVHIRGNIAYVSQSTAGVAIIDIQDPLNPQTIGNLDPGGVVREVDMYSNLLYIITDFNGFYLYDVSNPYNPKKISSWNDGLLHRGISVLKKHICLSTWGVGLKILDLTFIEKPVLIGTWNETNSYARGVYATIINEQKFAFLASSYDGVKIINITTPQSPKLVGTIFTGWGEMLEVTVKDGLAYCANADYGLLVANVSDPTNPVILDSFDTDGRTLDVAVEDGLAVIADSYHGIKFLDITTPTNIQFMSQFFDHGQASKLQIIKKHLFVADGRGGLEIFDISQPAVLDKLGFYRDEGLEVQDFLISDDVAFLTAFDNGLVVVNISDKTQPTKIASYNDNNYLRAVAIKGDVLFIAGLNNTIEMLNISNLSTISKIAEYAFPTTYADIYCLTVINSTLLVGSSYEGLTLLNISDINNISPLDKYNFGSTVFDVVTQGSLIFAAAGTSGLQIMNLTNNQLEFVGSFDSPGYTLDLALSGNYTFLAERTAGITIVNVSSLTSPQQVGRITKYDCYGLEVYEQKVFSGAWKAGVIVYDFDSDGDSISDETELLYGTDPQNPDTDGDQMPDGFEITFHLNPLDPGDASEDPDEDGLTNLEEYAQLFFYQASTDPFNPDTDGDQMPDGYEVDNHLDPLTANGGEDPDFDHLTNLEEYFIGTDPRKKDTDGDGASDGLEVLYNTDPFNPKDNPARRQLIRVLITFGFTTVLIVLGIIYLVKYFRKRKHRNIERERRIMEAEEEVLLF